MSCGEVAGARLEEQLADQARYVHAHDRWWKVDLQRGVVRLTKLYDWYGEEDGFFKVIVRKKTDRILGATLVARHAGQMISEITALMAAGRGLDTLSRTIHPYPTQAEALRKAGDAHARTALTPVVKNRLFALLAWRR